MRLEKAQTELLIIRFRRGETEAFNALVNIWEKRLFYFIRRIVRREEDAWDVLQETWLKVHRHLARLRDTAAFAAWAYRIARHAAISHLRRRERRDLLHEDAARETELEGSETYEFSEDDAERIHWGLDQLPLPQREALTLFFLEGFSLREIADVTQASTGTVKSRLHYGKKKLREVIEREGHGHE